MIWAGGNFTKYHNIDSMGVALIKGDGTYVGVTARPETSDVNWVGVSGFTLYVAGSFGKIGGIPCGNIAALDLNGNLASTFTILRGANASILHQWRGQPPRWQFGFGRGLYLLRWRPPGAGGGGEGDGCRGYDL
jgi:hypothetical protein